MSDSQSIRSSSGSGSSSDRRRNVDPSQQASQIEKSVTHLLVATKQLLETLTLWSRGTASETDVSDVYVRLGYEFNIACRAFAGVGIDTSDLGPVPDVLRAILEETLSQEASQQSLDRFLPRIRDIIINLLHGLKRKQQKLRQRTGRESQLYQASSNAISSASSTTAAFNGAAAAVASDLDANLSSSQLDRKDSVVASNLPPRTSSAANGGRTSPSRRASDHAEPGARRSGFYAASNGPAHPSPAHSSTASSQITTSSTTSGPISTASGPRGPPPPIPPPPYIDNNARGPADSEKGPIAPEAELPAVASTPGQQDALSALQRGGDLERRASRRFSAYQISKHLGVGVQAPMPPPPQNSPIPNRGREVQESLQAVRMRSTANLHARTRSKNNIGLENGTSPSRQSSIRGERRPEKSSATDTTSERPPSSSNLVQQTRDHSPSKYGNAYLDLVNDNFDSGARLTGPGELDQHVIYSSASADADNTLTPINKEDPPSTNGDKANGPSEELQSEAPIQVGEESAPDGPINLFLQYRTKVKKFVLANGYEDLTIAKLQLAFIEKFAWNTHSNGADLPEIYIQDAASGIRHELEDLADVKNNSVLVLNVDDMDEMKRHVDDGFGGLRKMVEEMKASLGDQHTALQMVSSKQMEAAKEIARIAALPQAPPSPATPPPAKVMAPASWRRSATVSQLADVQTLRREMAVMRQIYQNQIQSMKNTMSEIRTKAAAVKEVAAKVPATAGVAGRAHVNASKSALTAESEDIITRVDDLQDTIEELRKDVVTRGSRPLPQQLEKVSSDLAAATADLKRFKETMAREKTVWRKVHEEELQVVCDDQDVLRVQEEFANDLEDDLDKAAQTFALVDQATKQQQLQASGGSTPNGTPGSGGPHRIPSRTLALRGGADTADVDPLKAKDSMLGEVRALQPNHESRLEAIERAERLRRQELETRRDGEFKRELGAFVASGRLKQSGGVDEVERVREMREKAARHENWERAAARQAQMDAEEDDEEEEDDDEGEEDGEQLLAADAAHTSNGATLDVPTTPADDGASTHSQEFVEAKEAPEHGA